MILDSSLLLTEKTIVLTRSQDQQTESRLLFESQGAKVLDLPSLVVCPPEDWSRLDEALAELDSFHWIIFSSANGVNAVDQRLKLMGSSLYKRPKTLKIAAVGRKTAKLLESINVVPEFVPPTFVADSLIKHFPSSVYGLKILLPRVQTGGRSVLSEYLFQEGARVVEVSAYETKCPKEVPRETINAFKDKTVDAIVFTSSKTVAHTFQLLKNYFGDSLKDYLLKVKIVSIGPQTSISCKKYFNRIDQEASPHDLDGLVSACIQSMIKQ